MESLVCVAVWAVTLAMAMASILWAYRWSHPKANGRQLPPGSLGFPLLGETLQFFAPNPTPTCDVSPFVKERLDKYGNVFKTSIVARSVVMSADPELNYYVFQQEGKLFESWYPVLALIVVAVVSVTGAAGGSNKSLNITNQCSYTLWPGILSGAAAMDNTGFELAPGESHAMPVPSGWSGLLWGRTLCSADATTGKFTCVTGDCGSGSQACAGGGPAPPATLVQFTLDGSGGMDWYGVSLVDGFNVPVLVSPQSAAPGGNCAPAGCVVDLNGACPPELRVTTSAAGAGVVACKSACQAFGSPQYCCTGEYGNPESCKPSAYSEFFKHSCPRAFSYAYDGVASVFTCGGGSDTTYAINFCPISTTTSGKPSPSPDSQWQPPVTGNLPHVDGTMPYAAGSQVGAPTAATPPWVIILSLISAVLGFVTTVWGVVKLLKFSRQGADK